MQVDLLYGVIHVMERGIEYQEKIHKITILFLRRIRENTKYDDAQNKISISQFNMYQVIARIIML